MPLARVVDRAAHPHVVERRLRRVEQPDARRARPGRLLDAEPGVLLEPGQGLGRDLVDRLRLAALERGDTGARFRNELPDDAVEVRGPGPIAPRRLSRVGGITHDRRVVLRDVFRDHERPGADRVGMHLVPGFPHGLGRHDRQRAGRGQVQERRERGLEVDLERELVEDLRARVGGERGARAAGLEFRIDDPVEVELDRLGVERRAVVELDVAAQLEGDAAAVLRALPRLGEPRRQLSVRAPIEEVLGDGPDDLIGHGRRRRVRIQGRWLLIETDHERAAGLGQSRGSKDASAAQSQQRGDDDTDEAR